MSLTVRLLRTVCVTGLIWIGASCSKPRPLVVGGKALTEQLILAEIIARHVEGKLKLPVERKAGFASTSTAHEALNGGQVDLYVEYSGAAMVDIFRITEGGDQATIRDRVRTEYRNRLNIEYLEPLGFLSTPAVVIRGEDAREHKLESMSDVERWREGSWTLGITYDFLERADGWKRLNRVYSIPWGGTTRTFEPALLGRALLNKEVNMAVLGQSDAVFFRGDAVAPNDDKSCFPPYEPAIAVRRSSLEQHPGLDKVLRELAGRIDTAAMRRMNYEVEFGGRKVAEVAAEFLAKR